jgi:hypothetical protein
VQGSGNLVQTLLRQDLVDVFWLLVFPLVLGSGERLFGDGATPAGFKVADVKTSGTGVIAVRYERAGGVAYGSFAVEEATRSARSRRRRAQEACLLVMIGFRVDDTKELIALADGGPRELGVVGRPAALVQAPWGARRSAGRCARCSPRPASSNGMPSTHPTSSLLCEPAPGSRRGKLVERPDESGGDQQAT